jgi:hypothetical protein
MSSCPLSSQGTLEPFAYFHDAMPTGVTVSQKGRIFVNFPKWGDEVRFTVAEIGPGEGKAEAYPDEAINQIDPILAVHYSNLPNMVDQNSYV